VRLALILAPLLLTGCGPGFLAGLTAVGAVAGTIGTTEQLGITGFTDILALKKPTACVLPAGARLGVEERR
jgi:hypothetical protein